jgi:hypothetical protein
MSKPCTVCSLPKSKRNAIDSALVEGKTYSWIANRFSSAERTVSRSVVFRHSRHALAPPKGRRLPTASRELLPPPRPTATPSDAGRSLVDRVETLLLESKAIAAEAKSAQQWIAATAALREVRCCIELLAKLSGELASANVNFMSIDITHERALEFLIACETRGPQLTDYVTKQVAKRFGFNPPEVHVHFLEAKAKDAPVLPALAEPPAVEELPAPPPRRRDE